MRIRGSVSIPAVVAAVVLVASLAAAQTNAGQIAGVVRDPQGGLLPGATVIAEHLDTGTRFERLTDDQGPYHVPSLPVGRYVISVQLIGFQRMVRDGIVVQLGQIVTLDVTLAVAGLAEEIRVTAEVPLLQPANAEISDVIENREVVQLPLNGRNFLALAQLSAAVVIPPAQQE